MSSKKNNVIQFKEFCTKNKESSKSIVQTYLEHEVNQIYDRFEVKDTEVTKWELKCLVNGLYNYFANRNVDDSSYALILQFVNQSIMTSLTFRAKIDIFIMVDSLTSLRSEQITTRDINKIQSNILKDLRDCEVLQLSDFQKVKKYRK